LPERRVSPSETVIFAIRLILLLVDFDPLKCEYARHNAEIYNVAQNIQILNKDFLQLSLEDIKYPADRPSKMDVVFMSPPWGGIGYNMMPEYKLDYLFPDFKLVLRKALEFSRNLIIFLPKNTSVDEIVEYMIPLASQFTEDPENRKNELVIEIEQIVYGSSCKGIHIYTGELASIDTREMVDYFYDQYCQPFSSDEAYLKVILGNIFSLFGYKDFINYFKRDPLTGSRISLQKVIKKIQQKFSDEEWNFLKKYHKRSRTNSRRSSTLSHRSVEEEKAHSHSETSSVKSGKMSNTSSQGLSKKKLSKAEKLS
jgi:RNA cap guanine-N2 methyltransferase